MPLYRVPLSGTPKERAERTGRALVRPLSTRPAAARTQQLLGHHPGAADRGAGGLDRVLRDRTVLDCADLRRQT
ncbi:hypothetical protein ACQ4WX_04835 [Streptomyces lasalocidi]